MTKAPERTIPVALRVGDLVLVGNAWPHQLGDIKGAAKDEYEEKWWSEKHSARAVSLSDEEVNDILFAICNSRFHKKLRSQR